MACEQITSRTSSRESSNTPKDLWLKPIFNIEKNRKTAQKRQNEYREFRFYIDVIVDERP